MKPTSLYLIPSLALICFLGAITNTAQAEETKALALRTPPPEYPEALRRDGVTGTVVVKLLIASDGKVASAEVVKSNQNKLEIFAARAVRKWVFKPATRDGVNVESSLVIPIQFSLES